ncbi:MAG TPA: hypothetical protein VG406_23805, partial [Isosphaeraceae bacterium]|nr:hypothetical protein [Isosphaeraceae bacterium]
THPYIDRFKSKLVRRQNVIDWQVRIDGLDPPGWNQHRDGCWFPDFHHQEYLLPFFDVGDTPIDPYGGTEFRQADLIRLREHLRWHRSVFEAKPDAWSVTESSGDRSTTIMLERDKILAVVDKTFDMIEFALARAGTLVFRGD